MSASRKLSARSSKSRKTARKKPEAAPKISPKTARIRMLPWSPSRSLARFCPAVICIPNWGQTRTRRWAPRSFHRQPWPDMARPRGLNYSLSLLLTVPMVRGGARCVKDDLVVLPKTLEEPQGSAIAVAVLRCKLQNFGQRSVAVDGTEQPVLERVDSANKIGKFVRPVYKHRDATRRQTFPNAHRPWQCNGNVVVPTIAGEIDRLAHLRAIVAVGDEVVRDHCSAEEFDGGVLQPGRQQG